MSEVPCTERVLSKPYLCTLVPEKGCYTENQHLWADRITCLSERIREISTTNQGLQMRRPK